jgi:hypothetical protein
MGENPGPGTYDPRDPNAPITYTFGHEDRPNTVSRDQRVFPGPGSYIGQPGQLNLIGKDAP